MRKLLFSWLLLLLSARSHQCRKFKNLTIVAISHGCPVKNRLNSQQSRNSQLSRDFFFFFSTFDILQFMIDRMRIQLQQSSVMQKLVFGEIVCAAGKRNFFIINPRYNLASYFSNHPSNSRKNNLYRLYVEKRNAPRGFRHLLSCVLLYATMTAIVNNFLCRLEAGEGRRITCFYSLFGSMTSCSV